VTNAVSGINQFDLISNDGEHIVFWAGFGASITGNAQVAINERVQRGGFGEPGLHGIAQNFPMATSGNMGATDAPQPDQSDRDEIHQQEAVLADKLK